MGTVVDGEVVEMDRREVGAAAGGGGSGTD